jgi:uncharacterized protein (TIGR03067 family)
MKLKMLAVLFVGSLFAIGASGQEKGKTDQDKMQGTWSFEYMERGGVEGKEDFLKEAKLIVSADKVKVQALGKEMQIGFKLDPSKKPAHMDIIDTNGGKEVIIKGIYVFEDDKLKICWAPPGDKRPTEFKTELGSSEQMVVLKRDKQ